MTGEETDGLRRALVTQRAIVDEQLPLRADWPVGDWPPALPPDTLYLEDAERVARRVDPFRPRRGGA
jgi:hypothetical protein